MYYMYENSLKKLFHWLREFSNLAKIYFQERDKFRERQAEGKSPTHPREEGAPTPPWDPTPDRE